MEYLYIEWCGGSTVWQDVVWYIKQMGGRGFENPFDAIVFPYDDDN